MIVTYEVVGVRTVNVTTDRTNAFIPPQEVTRQRCHSLTHSTTYFTVGDCTAL